MTPDTLTPDPARYYRAYTADTDPAAAAALFAARYGAEPAQVGYSLGLLLCGPLPEGAK